MDIGVSVHVCFCIKYLVGFYITDTHDYRYKRTHRTKLYEWLQSVPDPLKTYNLPNTINIENYFCVGYCIVGNHDHFLRFWFIDTMQMVVRPWGNINVEPESWRTPRSKIEIVPEGEARNTRTVHVHISSQSTTPHAKQKKGAKRWIWDDITRYFLQMTIARSEDISKDDTYILVKSSNRTLFHSK